MAVAYENLYETTESGRGVGLLGNDSLASGQLAPDTKFDVAVTQSTKHLPPLERIQEIERREKMARELQQELNSKEKLQQKLWVKYKGEKNWPLPFWKLAHHSIAEDIPAEYRTRVRKMYFLWVLNSVALVWNCLCYILWASWPHAESERVQMSGGGAVVIIALLYACVGIPLSWQWWYKRYYNTYAGRVNNGRLGMRYFFNFSIHCLFAIVMAIGLEVTAAAGLLAMLKCIAHVTSLGMLMLVAFVLWCMVALGSAWLIRKHHIDYGFQIAGKYLQDQQAANNPRVVTAVQNGLQA